MRRGIVSSNETGTLSQSGQTQLGEARPKAVANVALSFGEAKVLLHEGQDAGETLETFQRGDR
jgi:hypothetical protein